MSPKFILHNVGRDQFLFTLTTHAGQVLLTSGSFIGKENVLRKIDATRNLAKNWRNYEVMTGNSGTSYFVIKTSKGEALAYSEDFPDEASLRSGMNLAKGNSHGAQLEDLTLPPTPARARHLRPSSS